MSIVNKILRLILAILLIPITSQAMAENCTPVAKLVSREGVVEVKPSGSSLWLPTKLEQHYCYGYSLRTGKNSRAAVRLVNDTLLRLDSRTTLSFTYTVQEDRTILDILNGIIHFLSRTPRSLKVSTPFVNAAVEGTEFVVRVSDSGTDVTVFEGVVVASNSAGSVKLADNQTGRAQAGQAPIRIAVARPRDAVAWALYYPPLPKQPGPAARLLQQTVAAIAQNRLHKAAVLAKQALAADSQSAAAFMAHSYVNQAQFDIPAALSNSQRAAELAPQSAITQARLAEVWLMTGDTRAARQAAARAIALDPNLAHTRSVLGFTSLREINLDAAKAAFEKAINLDSAAPLPRLGLGLVKIHRGDVVAGREEIETAALLDPNNALLRSYMGKAYYEEKRNSLASDQFAMAKELDPNDPTAWFYDSILLQSENRPVEALQAQQQAIKLNDNRGVYRSRQLLDKDSAARTVALGRIYNDLSFEQPARLQAITALAQDPGNHSAHRLLADSYVGITNLDAARQSELLQSKLTQPLNLDPLQPQLSNTNLGLLDGIGPSDLSYNEYNPLFTRNGMALQLDAAVAEEDTWSNDAIVAGLFDRFAFSLGQYHTETDGFRFNADYEQDIVNLFTQFAFSEDISLQFEISRDEVTKGDVSQRLLPDFIQDPDTRIDNEIDSVRVGLNVKLTNNIGLLLSAIQRDDDLHGIIAKPGFTTLNNNEKSTDIYEAQLAGGYKGHSWVSGINHHKEDEKNRSTFDFSPSPCPFPSCDLLFSPENKQTRVYGYFYTHPIESLTLTTGLTYLEEKNSEERVKKAYPKLGLQWMFKQNNGIRLAVFRSRASVVLPSKFETLEPTQIAGFNQLHDDLNLTDAWNYAAGYDYHLHKKLFAGISGLYRKLETPLDVTIPAPTGPPQRARQVLKYTDKTASVWLNWTPTNHWALGVDYSYSDYNINEGLSAGNTTFFTPDSVLELKTHQLPFTISYFHPSGFSADLKTTYYDQQGVFVNAAENTKSGEDAGWITDLAFSYRFPRRRGSVSVGVKNLFNANLRFEDRNSYDAANAVRSASPSDFSTEQLFFAKLSTNFR